MSNLIYEIIGWIGAILVLAAYILVSLNKLIPTGFYYQSLNLVGAICLIINTIYLKAYPSCFVNIVWVLVAVFTLYQKNKSK